MSTEIFHTHILQMQDKKSAWQRHSKCEQIFWPKMNGLKAIT